MLPFLPFFDSSAAQTVKSTTTWDPSKKDSTINLNATLLIASKDTGAADGAASVLSVAGFSGVRKYFEATLTRTSLAANDDIGFGNVSTTLGNYLGFNNNSLGWNGAGAVLLNTAAITTVAAYAAGDTLGLAIDDIVQKVWLKNITAGSGWNNDVIGNQNPAVGSQVGGISYATIATGPYFAGATVYWHFASGDAWTLNSGGSVYAIGSAPVGFSNI